MMHGFTLPPRPHDGHKGTFGSVCVIGGQQSEEGIVMVGAPTLTATAAMRSGCGNVVLAMPSPLIVAGLTIVPVATGIELPVDEAGRLVSSAAIEAIDTNGASARCFVIGPGLGCQWSQQQLVATLLSREERPIVLDADGLHALSLLESGQLELRAPTILTPHIGEYQRLATSLGLDVHATHAAAAEELARVCGCVVVLKGADTIISDGVRMVEVQRGGVVLATGGSGDVLAGIIAGLLVQYGDDCMTHLMDAAVLGVHIHAMAGSSFEAKHGNTGMLATDLLEAIPSAISSLRTEQNE